MFVTTLPPGVGNATGCSRRPENRSDQTSSALKNRPCHLHDVAVMKEGSNPMPPSLWGFIWFEESFKQPVIRRSTRRFPSWHQCSRRGFAFLNKPLLAPASWARTPAASLCFWSRFPLHVCAEPKFPSPSWKVNPDQILQKSLEGAQHFQLGSHVI